MLTGFQHFLPTTLPYMYSRQAALTEERAAEMWAAKILCACGLCHSRQGGPAVVF